MRVLLRHKNTNNYYAGPGVWTKLPGEARDFHTSAAAIQEVFNAPELRSLELEVVLAFDDPRYNVALPAPSRDRFDRGPSSG